MSMLYCTGFWQEGQVTREAVFCQIWGAYLPRHRTRGPVLHVTRGIGKQEYTSRVRDARSTDRSCPMARGACYPNPSCVAGPLACPAHGLPCSLGPRFWGKTRGRVSSIVPSPQQAIPSIDTQQLANMGYVRLYICVFLCFTVSFCYPSAGTTHCSSLWWAE